MFTPFVLIDPPKRTLTRFMGTEITHAVEDTDPSNEPFTAAEVEEFRINPDPAWKKVSD